MSNATEKYASLEKVEALKNSQVELRKEMHMNTKITNTNPAGLETPLSIFHFLPAIGLTVYFHFALIGWWLWPLSGLLIYLNWCFTGRSFGLTLEHLIVHQVNVVIAALLGPLFLFLIILIQSVNDRNKWRFWLFIAKLCCLHRKRRKAGTYKGLKVFDCPTCGNSWTEY